MPAVDDNGTRAYISVHMYWQHIQVGMITRTWTYAAVHGNVVYARRAIPRHIAYFNKIIGLSDPYVEIKFDGDHTSRKTIVRKKTLNPNWCHPLLLEVRSDRAVGELTKKGKKKGCYWFQYGNRLVLKVRQTTKWSP